MSFKEIEGGVCAPKGFLAGATYAGIRAAERDDLAILISKTPAETAGVLTRNLVHAWCVAHNRERLTSPRVSAVICNAGNANCSNGSLGDEADRGLEAAARHVAAEALGQTIEGVLTASTGVIGIAFPLDRVEESRARLRESVGSSAAHAARAARAIMTTDLVPKEVAVEVATPGGTFRIGGMAKGSGMIAPNMATMLGFISCDLAVDHTRLQRLLKRVTDRTFNRITVDGDTSTNDMVLLLANGESGVHLGGNELLFEEALEHVCRTLAKKIARDGEGATKLITITLRNPPEKGEKIARTIAESPLVKTACFGNDPNWGRIVAAAGRAGVHFDPAALVVRLAGFEVFRNGEPCAFDAAAVSRAMKQDELRIELVFGGVEEPALDFWTCDLSYDYVKINADYTT